RQHTGWQLALDGQVPVIHRRNLVFIYRIPAQDELIQGELRIRRRREGRGERINAALSCAAERRLRRRFDAPRVAERPWFDRAGQSAQYDLWAEGSLVDKPVVDDAVYAAIEEDSEPATQGRLAVTENIVRETDAGGEVVQAGADAVFRHTGVTREEHSGWRVGELFGMDTGEKVRQPKLLHAPLELVPGQERLIAQSQVHGQSPADMKIVLNIRADEIVAVILEFSRALTEGQVTRVIPELTGQESGEGWKAELRRLKESVIEIHPAALDHSTEAQVVFTQNPVHIITPGKVVAEECGAGIISEIKHPVHPDLLDGLRVGLKRQRDAQIRDANRVGRRAARGVFMGIAETEGIQQSRAEDMCILDKSVLRDDGRAVGIRQEIRGVKHRVSRKAVVEVPPRHLVILRE